MRKTMREGLHQLEFRRLDVRQHALGDSFVVDRIGDVIADRSAATIHGQLEIDHDGLPDAPLPLDEADDALGGQAAQEDAVVRLSRARHGCTDRAARARHCIATAPRRASRAAIARGPRSQAPRAARPSEASAFPQRRSLRHCRCRIRSADKTRGRRARPTACACELRK